MHSSWSVLESVALMQIPAVVNVLNAYKHTTSHMIMHYKWAKNKAHVPEPGRL